MTTLLVDAGGTNIRSAWTDGEQRIRGEQSQPADAFESLLDALQTRCHEDRVQPEIAIIAVAGPVSSDRVKFTNRSWEFSQLQLKKDLQLKHLVVMNDFAAVALSLPILGPSQLDIIKQGYPLARATMLAIGPGTGLGISCVVPNGNSWLSVPGEGGHGTAALDGLVPAAAQLRLWDSGWLSWESVLSGPGLVRLHAALHGTHDMDNPEQVTTAAARGDENAGKTLSCFAALLGRRASDTAMVVGAWGGVFLAGGMIKSMGDLFDRVAFCEGFEGKGASRDLVRRIPVSLIIDPYPTFIGLIHAASIKFPLPQSAE